MLTLAAEHVEARRWPSPYELVTVDEFQELKGTSCVFSRRSAVRKRCARCPVSSS